MKKITLGSTIKLHFEGRLADGEVFDSTEGFDPVIVEIGTDLLIPKLEEILLGMQEGEKRSFTILAADAYGPRDETLERTISRSELPPDYEPEAGDILTAENPETRQPVRVKAFNETEVVLDLNHPLAGRDLIYDVQIVEIVPPVESKES